jgi:hypothetical protein
VEAEIVRAAMSMASIPAAAVGLIPARVTALVEGGRGAVWTTGRKVGAVVVLAAGLAGLGAAVLSPPAAATRRPEPAKGRRLDDPAQLARDQEQSRRNLKKLAAAMHRFIRKHGHLPAPAIYRGQGKQPAPVAVVAPPMGGAGGAGDAGPAPGAVPAPAPAKVGKPLLSWRVALLPDLGESALYRQFRLDEPWDGPHNKNLLARMSPVYAAPGRRRGLRFRTFYQVFVGPGAAFERGRVVPYPAGIPDGTSNTLLIVEAGRAVPWTKPEDLEYGADKPLPALGGLFRDIFNAAFADGEVYPLKKRYDVGILHKAIQRADGWPVDVDKLKAASGPPPRQGHKGR